MPEIVMIPSAGLMKRGEAREGACGDIAVTGGTAISPVAEEAVRQQKNFSAVMWAVYDVGVAGIHRLSGSGNASGKPTAWSAVAGMEKGRWEP